MQKYGDVAILTQKNSNKECGDDPNSSGAGRHMHGELKQISVGKVDLFLKVRFLIGSRTSVEGMPHLRAREPFADVVLDFLNDVSRILMAEREAKAYPDVITFAFWIRRASTEHLKARFCQKDGFIRLARGTAFHIAPSNVPVNYAYSLAAGLLTGNANIVRIPSKDSPQVGLINRAFREALEKHVEMTPYICLVRYGREREVNDLFSSMADVRIIWGGDATIREIRRSPLGPRAGEIKFADRFSITVIDSDTYLDEYDKEKTTEEFYNDTYLTDQNACTSPRLIVWLGNQKEEAKREFWSRLHRIVERKYHFQEIQGVDKLAWGCLLASELPGVTVEPHMDNLLVRVKVPAVPAGLIERHGSGGYFLEYDCEDIMELRDICNDQKCQTVAYIGRRDMLLPLLESGVRGIDRVVPVGKTMDFDLIWDGYNLFERLTRIVEII